MGEEVRLLNVPSEQWEVSQDTHYTRVRQNHAVQTRIFQVEQTMTTRRSQQMLMEETTQADSALGVPASLSHIFCYKMYPYKIHLLMP